MKVINQKKDTVKSTDHMDVVLLDALLKQQVNGNHVDETLHQLLMTMF